MKTCKRCSLEKEETGFHKGKPWCKVCTNAYNAAWRKSNPESNSASVKKWREGNRKLAGKRSKASREKKLEVYRKKSRQRKLENRDVVLVKNAEYRARTRDRRIEYNRLYRKLNPAIGRRNRKMREDRKRSAILFPFSNEELDQRMSVFGHICVYCGGPFEHIDHVIPLARGGYHQLSNLRPSCKFCNLSKGAKSLQDWKRHMSLVNK